MNAEKSANLASTPNFTDVLIQWNQQNLTSNLSLIEDDPVAFSQDWKILEPILQILVPILFSFIIILGFIGNILVVFVVTLNKNMRNTTNLLILNLAVSSQAWISRSFDLEWFSIYKPCELYSFKVPSKLLQSSKFWQSFFKVSFEVFSILYQSSFKVLSRFSQGPYKVVLKFFQSSYQSSFKAKMQNMQQMQKLKKYACNANTQNKNAKYSKNSPCMILHIGMWTSIF